MDVKPDEKVILYMTGKLEPIRLLVKESINSALHFGTGYISVMIVNRSVIATDNPYFPGGFFLACKDYWENVQPFIPCLRCLFVVVFSSGD